MTNVTCASLLLFCLSLVVCAQSPNSPKLEKQDLASTEREVRAFYDSYAEDLRWHRRDAIADRYDPNGTFFVGQGNKSLESFEANKKYYQTKWMGPKSFEWKDLSIEVLSPDAAVVVGRFEWEKDSGETSKFSYTALVKKYSGGWRIRVEDESTQPPKSPTP